VFTHHEVKKILAEKKKNGLLKRTNIQKRAMLMRHREFFEQQGDLGKAEE